MLDFPTQQRIGRQGQEYINRRFKIKIMSDFIKNLRKELIEAHSRGSSQRSLWRSN